ncbi:MAG: hypothetical protein WKF61_00620 [Luteimonas sp.]
MNTIEKTCFKCGLSKARAEFYGHPQMADGLLGKCKDCTKSDVRGGRNDSTREYDRRRYLERTHEHRARIKVNYAITKGQMKRPAACWFCGGKPPIEGHHADYANPLGVMFLCKPCHSLCHKLTTAVLASNGYAERLAIYLDQEIAA